jgi:hypothetical protein
VRAPAEAGVINSCTEQAIVWLGVSYERRARGALGEEQPLLRDGQFGQAQTGREGWRCRRRELDRFKGRGEQGNCLEKVDEECGALAAAELRGCFGFLMRRQ